MTAYLLKPYDKDGTITAAALLGRPTGSPAKVEELVGLSATPDSDYDMIMRKQAERKHG